MTAQGRETYDDLVPLAMQVKRQWEIVRRWPALSASAKLAWKYLADECLVNWGEAFCCTPTDVGLDQGTSLFAGARGIKALVAEKLGKRTDNDERTGVWSVKLYRPSDIARAQPVTWDGQHVLPFCDSADSDSGERGRQVECNLSELPEASGGGEPTALTQRPVPRVWQPAAAGEGTPAAVAAVRVADAQAHAHPQRALPSEPSEHLNVNQPSTFGLLKVSASENVHPGERVRRKGATSGSASASGTAGCDGRPAVRDSRRFNRQASQPAALGDVLAALAADRRGGIIADPADRQAWVERLVAHTRQRVNCPNLRQAPCLDIASAIVEGRLPEKELAGILAYIERIRANGKLGTTPASKIFIGFVKRVRGQYCLEGRG